MFSSVLLFFEFSAPEIMLILFVTLLLFGGDKLPGLAKGLGKGIREFKDASEGVKREINNQINEFENKKREEAAASTKVEEETPLIAETSTDNAEETPKETINITPVANTVSVGSNPFMTSDNNAHFDTDSEDLQKHYHGVTEDQGTPTATAEVAQEPENKDNIVETKQN